jgi:hypothetical protein
VISAVLIGGLAFVGYRIYLNEVHDSAIELVPRDAVFYGNLYLNPSTHQKQALRDLLRNFPDTGTAEQTRATIEELFDNALAPVGLEFERDVEPWLGRQVGAFARVDDDGSLSGAVLVGTTDADAALDAVHAAADDSGQELEADSYGGNDYEVTESGAAVGIVDDFLVIATRADELRASVDATREGSLSEDATFRSTSDGLPEERVAFFYVNAAPYFAIAQRDDPLPVDPDDLARFFGSPAAGAVYLRPDGIVLDASLPESMPEPGAILEDLPAGGWAGAGIEDFGPFAERHLDLLGPFGAVAADIAAQESLGLDFQDDLLPWIGDLAFYAGGDLARPDAAVRIESTDEAESARVMKELEAALITRGVSLHLVRVERYNGFEGRPGGQPTAEPVVVLYGENVVIADSRATARRMIGGGHRLADEGDYPDAVARLGDGMEPAFFGRVQPFVNGIQNYFQEYPPTARSTTGDEVERNLEPFSFIIYGSRRAEGRTMARLVIGVE